MRGIKALEKGLIWRVGDGDQIRIWEDPWIRMVLLVGLEHQKGAVLLAKVHELINPAMGQWDEQLIRDVF